jgi:hypothetical protein
MRPSFTNIKCLRNDRIRTGIGIECQNMAGTRSKGSVAKDVKPAPAPASRNGEAKLFGSPRRTQILVALSVMEDAYPSLLADLLNAKLFSVQQILDGLVEEGVVSSFKDGKLRIVTLNRDYIGHSSLALLLRTLIHQMPELKKAILDSGRGRPWIS